MDVDWIHPTRDKYKWRSDAVKFSAVKAWGIAWLAEELGALYESLSTVKTVRCILGFEKCYIRGRHTRKGLLMLTETRLRHLQLYSEPILGFVAFQRPVANNQPAEVN